MDRWTNASFHHRQIRGSSCKFEFAPVHPSGNWNRIVLFFVKDPAGLETTSLNVTAIIVRRWVINIVLLSTEVKFRFSPVLTAITVIAVITAITAARYFTGIFSATY